MKARVVNGIKTKLLVPHAKGCRAVQHVRDGTWGSPWVLPEIERDVRRDRAGRVTKHGTWWLVFRCNTSNCDARLIALCDDIERLLPVGDE